MKQHQGGEKKIKGFEQPCSSCSSKTLTTWVYTGWEILIFLDLFHRSRLCRPALQFGALSVPIHIAQLPSEISVYTVGFG